MLRDDLRTGNFTTLNAFYTRKGTPKSIDFTQPGCFNTWRNNRRLQKYLSPGATFVTQKRTVWTVNRSKSFRVNVTRMKWIRISVTNNFFLKVLQWQSLSCPGTFVLQTSKQMNANKWSFAEFTGRHSSDVEEPFAMRKQLRRSRAKR